MTPAMCIALMGFALEAQPFVVVQVIPRTAYHGRKYDDRPPVDPPRLQDPAVLRGAALIEAARDAEQQTGWTQPRPTPRTAVAAPAPRPRAARIAPALPGWTYHPRGVRVNRAKPPKRYQSRAVRATSR